MMRTSTAAAISPMPQFSQHSAIESSAVEAMACRGERGRPASASSSRVTAGETATTYPAKITTTICMAKPSSSQKEPPQASMHCRSEAPPAVRPRTRVRSVSRQAMENESGTQRAERRASRSERRGRRPAMPAGLGVAHALQEFLVRLGLRQALQEQLHRFDGGERGEHLAQDPRAVELVLGHEQLLLARAAAVDVDGGEDALVGELAVEHDLRVARPLELLEDHVVHARARLHQGAGDDGERAALFHVARGAEEALGPLQDRKSVV